MRKAALLRVPAAGREEEEAEAEEEVEEEEEEAAEGWSSAKYTQCVSQVSVVSLCVSTASQHSPVEESLTTSPRCHMRLWVLPCSSYAHRVSVSRHLT